MQFVTLFFEDDASFAARTDPERSGPYWGSWMAYVEAVRAAGVMVGGNGLQPPATATTVRLRDGKRMVQDGPYADTKEQLAGYFVLEVENLDVALDWASRAPCAADGAVEVRPVLPPMQG